MTLRLNSIHMLTGVVEKKLLELVPAPTTDSIGTLERNLFLLKN